MRATKYDRTTKLPGKFDQLVQLVPPQAILDDVHYENTVEMIDRLMATGKLTKGQEHYLETLVQLVQVYETSHHAIDAPQGIELLKYLMAESALNASALARILGVHASSQEQVIAQREELFLREQREILREAEGLVRERLRRGRYVRDGRDLRVWKYGKNFLFTLVFRGTYHRQSS